jgi:GT2 family glycosyltransferase
MWGLADRHGRCGVTTPLSSLGNHGYERGRWSKPSHRRSMKHFIFSQGLAALKVVTRALDRTLGSASSRIRDAARHITTLIEEERSDELRKFAHHLLAKVTTRVTRRPLLDPSEDPVVSWLDRASTNADRAETLARIQSAAAELAPRISVVIPCYNYGLFLEEAVSSVERQTIKPVDLIVVDDGSTDAQTMALLDRLASERRVALVRQSNQGLSAARNVGAAKARGDLILFLDADDRIDPSALAILSYALHACPGAAYAYSYTRFFGDMNFVFATQTFNEYDLLWSNHPSVTALIRRSAFEQSPKYQSRMSYGYEDWELWLALAERGFRGVCVPVPIFEHRKHGATMTSRAHRQRSLLFDRLLELHPDLYKPDSISARKQRERPCLSVILSLDGPSSDLEKTLTSLARQTIDDFDVVLVTRRGNGRTDSPSLPSLSHQILRDPSAHSTEIFHRAALAARGEFLIFLRPGDALGAHGLEQLMLALCCDPRAAFAAGNLAGGSPGGRRGYWFSRFGLMQNRMTSRVLMAKRAYMMLAEIEVQHSLPAGQMQRHICARLRAAQFRGPTVPAIMTNVGSDDMAGVGKPDFAHGSATLLHRSQLRAPPALDPLLAQLAVCWRHSFDPPLKYDRFRRGNTPNPFPRRYWRDDVHPALLYFAPHNTRPLEADVAFLSQLKRAGARLTVIGTYEFKRDHRERLESLTEDVFILSRVAPNSRAAVRVASYVVISRNIDVICVRRSAVADRLRKRFAEKNVAFVRLEGAHLCPEDILATAATIDRAAKLREFHKMILQQPLF